MFAPLPDGSAAALKKRKGATVSQSGEEVLSDRKAKELLQALAKGHLQLVEENRHRSRDENIMIQVKGEHVLAQGMESSIEKYDEMGKEARGKVANMSQYRGHPEGKRPDALFRALLVRICQCLEAKATVIEEKLSSLAAEGGKIRQHLGVIQSYGNAAMKEGCPLRCTRSFRIKQGEDIDEVHKFIFFSASEPDLMSAFRMLRASQFLDCIDISLEVDGAPRSGHSKRIHDMVYGSGHRGAQKGGG
mmetsp:Transcript_292/g.732  ORF Transcript_292/g.732 Transcript_292/m.732 type:complete len:247 (-) Transcript_292:346-1086(-)